jgi:hypothetical protein
MPGTPKRPPAWGFEFFNCLSLLESRRGPLPCQGFQKARQRSLSSSPQVSSLRLRPLHQHRHAHVNVLVTQIWGATPETHLDISTLQLRQHMT